jgi:hypothetical protein
VKRVFILTLVVLFGVAVSAQAQGRLVLSPTTSAAAASPASAGIFGKASIDRAVAKTVGAAVPAPPRAGKSFWKGPWPWVIGGGIAAAAIIVATQSGSNNGTGGGIYKAPVR